MQFKNLKMVDYVVYGRGCFSQLDAILAPRRIGNAPMIFIVDHYFENNAAFIASIPTKDHDQLLFADVSYEPKTSTVDAIADELKSKYGTVSGIIGIGGGSVLDLAAAVSIMMTNPGLAQDYQGWDLVKNPAIYHVGIPTISGTGAEVSRTTVLTGPERKLGINSDYTPFDQVVLDSELTKEVPKDQWFYTGMDCYIHCIESLTGTYLNAFSESYGKMALDLCKEIFLEGNLSEVEAQEKLMMASWHGGMSIAYSQVGIAHAMSYGLSYLLGTKHGVGNCIVFDHLEAFYPEGVKLFKQMKAKHKVTLPQGICADLNDREYDIMIDVALSLEPLWENAIGKNWKKIITREKLRTLYQKM
mgnify:CR=1 FL=1